LLHMPIGHLCNSLDQAVHYHIYSVQVVGFISDVKLCWLQSEEVSYSLIPMIWIYMSILRNINFNLYQFIQQIV
jgi:hypothetical protein